MTSTRETVIQALHATLKDALQKVPPVRVLRNEPLPVTIPPDGLVIVRDGVPGIKAKHAASAALPPL